MKDASAQPPLRTTSTGAPAASGLWDSREVATFLHVSRSWVYQKAEAGLLPVVRMPGSSLLRFDPEAIRAYARGDWKPAQVIPFRPASRG